jgi:single-strand DNA-binding protein
MSKATLTISGNLTQEPELIYTEKGVPRLSFSVAVNYGYDDAQGQRQEKTSFFNVTAWRYLAENSARTLEKGIGVIVTGRLEQRSYEDKDGNKRSAVDLIADEIGIATRSIESLARRQKQSDEATPTQVQRQASRSTQVAQQKSSLRTRPTVPAGAGRSGAEYADGPEEPF